MSAGRRKSGEHGGKMRIQKYLSEMGIVSRRTAEELIAEGQILVNDEVVARLPVFVDPARDRVVVRGAVVRTQRPRYFMMNKPRNVVCTSGQKSGRTRVVDLMPPLDVKVNPVGRLDPEATGLVLLTNDGELAQRLAHPRYGIAKQYLVEIEGQATQPLVAALLEGVHLAEGRASASAADIQWAGFDRSVLWVSTHDQFPRQIQRMLAKLGHDVRKLERIAVGPLALKGLPIGAVRELSIRELAPLLELAGKARRRHKPRVDSAGSRRPKSATSGRDYPAGPQRNSPQRRAVKGRPAKALRSGRKLID